MKRWLECHCYEMHSSLARTHDHRVSKSQSSSKRTESFRGSNYWNGLCFDVSSDAGSSRVLFSQVDDNLHEAVSIRGGVRDLGLPQRSGLPIGHGQPFSLEQGRAKHQLHQTSQTTKSLRTTRRLGQVPQIDKAILEMVAVVARQEGTQHLREKSDVEPEDNTPLCNNITTQYQNKIRSINESTTGSMNGMKEWMKELIDRSIKRSIEPQQYEGIDFFLQKKRFWPAYLR